MKLMSNRPSKCLHWRDAITLLESGQLVTIKVWKLSTGDIITYRDAFCIGSHWRRGIHRIKLPQSHLIREFRDITLFEINGYEVIR